MQGEKVNTILLNAILNSVPSAVLLVDEQGILLGGKISDLTAHKTKSIAGIGQQLDQILRVRLDPENVEKIMLAFRRCIKTNDSLLLPCITNCKNDIHEYFRCSLVPVPNEKKVTISFINVTETILIQKEFDVVAAKYGEVNVDLQETMFKLDLQLMDIDRAHKNLTALYKITSIVQKTVDESELLNEVLDCMMRECGFTKTAIFLLDEERQELVCRAQRGGYMRVHLPVSQGVMGHAIAQRELIYIQDVMADSRYIASSDHPGSSEVAIPLIVNDRMIGVLDIEASQKYELQNYDFNFLRSLAGHIAMTIAHAQHVVKVEQEAITDSLTGLYNKRYFNDLITKEIRRSNRYSRSVSMLMIDIDYYKQYNDKYGHRMGDEALKVIASIIRQSCRDVDFAVRYGGEEFVLLLLETSMAEAIEVSERLRKTIEYYPFPHQHHQSHGSLSVSIGLSNYPDDAWTEIELIDHSDAALYAAKRAGRNCVRSYSADCVFFQSNNCNTTIGY
ncbi:MAG: diguanylate cyclase with sensor [Firmicutes bacterium]|nr:diguanylate cyclase with sensor [Bacillota bacterium]